MKTQGISLIPIRYVSPGIVFTSSEFDVTNLMGIGIFISYCQTDTTNHQVAPPKFIIEGQCGGYWTTLTSWEPNRTSPAVVELSSPAQTGTKTLNFSSTPGFWEINKPYFLRHEFVASPTTLGRSEFVHVQSKTTTTVTLVDGTKYMHKVSVSEKAYLYNLAEHWPLQLNVMAYTKVRILVDAGIADKTFVTEAFGTQLDPT